MKMLPEEALVQGATVPQLAPELGQLIQAEAFIALKSIPKRGVEIGGFLYSSQDSGTVIDGLELVPCQYLSGPFYRPSAVDVRVLREKAEMLAVYERKRLMGFFRSCTRDQFIVEPEDDLVMREMLPPGAAILLAKPLPSGKAITRLFLRDKSGQWTLAEEGRLEYLPAAPPPVAPPEETSPARPRQMEGESLAQPLSPNGQKAMLSAPSMEAQASAYFPAPPRRMAWWVAGFLAFAAVLGLAWFYEQRSQIFSPNTEMGLQVDVEGGNLRIRWNRNLPAFRSAKLGILQIFDGAQHRNILLDPDQLAHGSILYKSESGDVTFRLEVESVKNAPISESVRALNLTKATHEEAKPETESSFSSASVPTPISVPPVGLVTSPSFGSGSKLPRLEAPKPKIPPVGETAKPTDKAVTQGQDVMVPPASSAPPVRSSVAATEPPTPTQDTVSAAPTEVVSAPPAPLLAIDHGKPLELATAPTSTSLATGERLPARQLTVQPSSSSGFPAAASDFVPPKPLQRVVPKVQPIGTNLVQKDTDIQILVTINEAGHVTAARQSGTESKNTYLVGQAITAAKQWTFEPAKVQGHNVPSSHTIKFHFGAAGNR